MLTEPKAKKVIRRYKKSKGITEFVYATMNALPHLSSNQVYEFLETSIFYGENLTLPSLKRKVNFFKVGADGYLEKDNMEMYLKLIKKSDRLKTVVEYMEELESQKSVSPS